MATASTTHSKHGSVGDRLRLDTESLEEMSSDDLRNALYERLHNKGLLDTLKSQLRNYMVAELHGKGYNKKKAPARGDKPSLERKLLESLIYKYLCDMGCDYTVGVFLPEAGITKREILSSDEMKRLLKLPSNKSCGDDSILLLIISHLMSREADDNLTDGGTQTDVDHMLLTDKLARIDTEYASAQGQCRPADTAGSVEERLHSYQKKIELAASQKSQEDMERWKLLEIQTIQVTEREKQQRELQDRRRQLEEEYRRKVAAVTEREKSLTDSAKVEYESVQRETFMQRQQLLQQSEEMRRREAEIREEKTHTERLHRVNEEKMEKIGQMLKKREAELYQKELHMDNTMRNQQERCRMEEKLAYDSKYRELKAWEEKLKDKECSVEREKRNLLTNNERKELLDLRQSKKELETQVNKYSLQTSGLEMTITGLHERLARMFDYEVIKESNISLKKNLEMTKDRLDSLIKENSLLQEKYEHVMIDGREKAGVGEIMMIKTQMQKERDRALDDKVLLEHRLKEMESKFTDQLRKNHVMVKEFELQTDRQRYMNKEYGELRQQLGSSAADSSRRHTSPLKDASFYDTTFRQTLPPELALDADWIADISSGAEVSTATEESIVTETRKRLDHLTSEAENLHSAFKSLTRQTDRHIPSGHAPNVSSPSKSLKATLAESHVSFHPSTVASVHYDTMPPVAQPMSSLYDTMPPVTQPMAPRYDTMPPVTQPVSSLYNIMPPVTHEMTSPYDTRAPNTSSLNIDVAKDVERTANHKAGKITPPTSDCLGTQSRIEETFSQADQFSRPTPNKIESQAAAQEPSTAPTSLDSQWQVKPANTTSPLESQLSKQAVDQVPPTSLDSQWQPRTTVSATPTSLDSQWQPRTTVSATPTSLDSQWRTQTSDVPPLSSLETEQNRDNPIKGAATALSSQLDKKVEDDGMAGIDPAMQKYMKMIQKQKEAEKKNAQSKPSEVTKVEESNDEQSISDHISLVKSDNGEGAATDEDFW